MGTLGNFKKRRNSLKVFTPFYRKGCLGSSPPRVPLPKPPKINLKQDVVKNNEFDINKTNTNNWQKSILSHALIGEKKAFERLEFFIKNGLKIIKMEEIFHL